MIELEEMSFLLFNLCNDMNKNGLDYDDDHHIINSTHHIINSSYY